MSIRPTTPTPQEVDSLGAFIEAVEELEREPFFRPDDKLKIVIQNGKTRYEFGDRFHFRSALVSFRRVWLEGEASYFYVILKLLRKYEGEGLWLPWIHSEHQRIEGSQIMGGVELKGKELVNLWLNSVFAHNNLKQKHSNPKLLDRKDFERYDNKFGHARFEYSFRVAVRQFGLCYRNLLKLAARPALQRWENTFELKPSFQIGAPFGFGVTETTKDGAAIIRQPSTEYGSPESPEQKLIRILSRNEFRSLNSILDQLGSANLLPSITQAQTYQELLANSGFEIKLEDDISIERINQDLLNHEAIAVIPCNDLAFIPTPDPTSIFYAGKKIVTQQAAIDFFERKFARLKKLLVN